MNGWRAPPGYVSAAVGGGTLVAREAAWEAARTMVEHAGSLQSYARMYGRVVTGRGRGATAHVTTSEADWVVRHYRRGGAFGRLLDDRYARVGIARPFAELTASEAALARGVPTPPVEAAFLEPHPLFYRADIATRFVPDAADLATLVFFTEPAAEACTAAWRAAGRLVAASFAAGVIHADLNLGNILVQRVGDRATAQLLDLDRARIVARVDARRRTRMLARLHRSRRKLERATGRLTPAADLAAFEAGMRDEAPL